jgi:hypothetical protein
MHKTPGIAIPVFALLVLSVIQILATGQLSATSTRDLNSQSGAVAGFLDAEFDKTVAALQKRADMAPNMPENWHALAKHYYEKVKNDANLPRDLAKAYVMHGLEFEKRALLLDPNYYDAMVLRGSLLRQAALYEKNPAIQKKLIAEADALKQRAADLPTNGKIGR